jgi:hypothetical protein
MKLFGGARPDHPMAERKDAQRLLDALPAHDGKALEELGHFHDTVSAAPGFKPEERAARVAMIDEAAQPRVKKIAREYFAAVRGAGASKAQENVFWSRMHEYWREAAQAYVRCADERPANAVVLGALRALGQQLKWQQLRYGPINLEVWGLANRMYATAEARGIAEARPEYLRLAMFAASAPDSLAAHELELAERLISDFAASFVVAAAPAAELPYWIYLAEPMAPARGAKPPQPAASLRYFGAGSALGTLQTFIKRTEAQRAVPSDLKLGPEYDPETVLGVMRHLALQWGPGAPERKHKRVGMDTKLKVAHGFDGVLGALGGSNDSLDFGAAAAVETWTVENVSAGGFGARAPQAKADWLKVGALLAAQPDNTGTWLIGAVRRVNKVSSQEVRVGVETLARTAAISQFALPNATRAQGVVMPTPSGEAAIALRAGTYVPGANLEASVGGRQHVYMPQGVAERGDDYEIVRFREMVRES